MEYWGKNPAGSGYVLASELPAGTRVFAYNNPQYPDPTYHPNQHSMATQAEVGTHYIGAQNEILPLAPDGTIVPGFNGNVTTVAGQTMIEIGAVGSDQWQALTTTPSTVGGADIYSTGAGANTVLGLGDTTTAITAQGNQGAQGASGMANGMTTPSGWTDWSNVFGEYTPQQQYRSMLTTDLPQYNMPRYAGMAERQFQPSFGRFLLGGYGAPGTDTLGNITYGAPTNTGLGTSTQFSDWYGDQTGGIGLGPAANPLGIQAGYNLAQQFGGMMPNSEQWQNLSGAGGAEANLGMAYAMQDPAAVQAMAMARLYGGGRAPGGYAGRAQEASMQSLYNNYMARGAQQGITGPASFLPYLATLSPGAFGSYPTV